MEKLIKRKLIYFFVLVFSLRHLIFNFFRFDNLIYKSVCRFFCKCVILVIYIPPKANLSIINKQYTFFNGCDEKGRFGMIFSWFFRKFKAHLFVVYFPIFFFFIGYVISSLKKVIINPLFWVFGHFYYNFFWFLIVLFLRFITFWCQIFVYLSLIVYCIGELAVEFVEICFCFFILFFCIIYKRIFITKKK